MADDYFEIKHNPIPENLGNDYYEPPNKYENLALRTFDSAGQNLSNLNEVQDNEDDIKNEMLILTRDDGLVHNYFHYFECYWDAGDCLATVILKFPKTDRSMISYWSKYQGDVYIYSGKEFSKARFESDEAYDIDDITPIFVGSVSHIREFYNEIEIYIHNIGTRFKQKIPEEFRNYYIFNQNVRDTFQAICEFLGVKYICPPQSISTGGSGTENDADAKIDSEAQAGTTSQPNNTGKILEAISQMGGSLGLSNLKFQNGTVTNKETKTEDTETSTDENTTTNGNITDNTMIGGFANVSFDAGGNLVYNSQIIESTPDLAKSIIATESSWQDMYGDFGEVLNDIEDFLNGKIFETVHNNVMDYNAITIVPQTAPTSTITSATNGETEDGKTESDSGKTETGGSENADQ